MKRKSNKKVWDTLKTPHKDYLIQAGWFENSKYDNGVPIGGIAAVQNYGAVINHPGGTPYYPSEFKNGMAVFVSKDSHWGREMMERGLITKPHTIVIPPTHFWENAQEKNRVKWKQEFQEKWQSVFLGNTNPDSAMEQIASMIEGDIAKEIANGDYPPDKPSTVRAKMNRYANKKEKGDLDKRLVDTGQMFAALSHKVEKL